MKLLQKTIRSYFIYSCIILVVAIPVFYFVIQSIVQEDVDEDLVATKENLRPKIAKALEAHKINQLQFLDHDITVSLSTHAEEFDAFNTIEIYDSIAKEMVPHRVLTTHMNVNGTPCLLQVKISMVDKDELIKSIVQVQVLLLILLLTGLFVINRRLSEKIWKPFYNTLDKLRNYKVEDHEPLALGKSSINEFDDLNRSLEGLTDRTHQAYIGQKEFAENAAHEMQTPLAVFQGKLELLMQTLPLNEEQAILMGDLADASQRMVRLNKSLVLLTKIENYQFAGKENVCLNEVISDLISQFEPQVIEKKLSFDVDLKEEVCLQANRTVIEILISNILGNTIRHNYPKGRVVILLKENILTVQNTGRAGALEEQKIFTRFQKESTDSTSIGLGLEIVKKICNLYGFAISYQFVNDLHSFSVRLNTSQQ
ncbi:MAG: HAMP domain-containing sensor histidine kinase [Ferruginibacter sp.]